MPEASPARPAGAPPSTGARSTLREARALAGLAAAVLARETPVREAINQAYAHRQGEVVDAELAKIPVSRLREASDDRLRIGALEEAGYTTVLDVHRADHVQLDRLPGLGEKTAKQAIAVAASVARAVAEGVKVRIDLDTGNAHSTKLLRHLEQLVEVDRAAPAARRHAEQVTAELTRALAVAKPARSRLRMFFAGKERRAQALAAVATIERILIWARANDVAAGLQAAHKVQRRRLRRAKTVWKDFELHSPEFYSALSEVVDGGQNVAASEGFLSEDIVARVRAQSLDERFRRVALRGYQSFGARFALVQRRVIIGDEMGLGKTIQAIAVLSHLRAGDGPHYFLVVCPASVLVNWTREISTRSHLKVHRLHGPDREANMKTWLQEGDVAVTTVDSLHDLDVPAALRVAALIVDEAHYVKNPEARRSVAVRTWTARADRVLFLTGSPMENRVEEFRSLVGYLQPRVLPSISGTDAVAGAVAFRQAVAPVYLRRNQEDVLTELPDLVSKDEWVEFSPQDFRIYREAVASGNFMSMRRAAYATKTVDASAKLGRLAELVDDAAANGRKVVIFSYFRDVLDIVHATVRTVGDLAGARAAAGSGPAAAKTSGKTRGTRPGTAVAAAPRPVFGPLTGSVAPAARQRMVDDFSAIDGHAVLISQIQAGGVGLNIQAASVVIICEPQVKPTTEDQAIARSHRMGQVRSVQVHRLLTPDSVDERMREILATKSRLFDEYARQSHLADNSPDAMDVTDTALARQVVAAERERLALG